MGDNWHPSMWWRPPTPLEMAVTELARCDAERDQLRFRLSLSEALVVEQTNLIADYRLELAEERRRNLAHQFGEATALELIEQLAADHDA